MKTKTIVIATAAAAGLGAAAAGTFYTLNFNLTTPAQPPAQVSVIVPAAPAPPVATNEREDVRRGIDRTIANLRAKGLLD